MVFWLWLFGEVALQKAFGLVGQYMFAPICLWANIGVSGYLNNIATMEFCFDGAELSVDTGVVGMFSDVAVDLKGEIECCGTLGKIDGLPLWCKHHNIIIVEGSNDTLYEASLRLMELQVFQHSTELVNPLAYTLFTALGNNTNLVVANHPLTADVNLFPTAKL